MTTTTIDFDQIDRGGAVTSPSGVGPLSTEQRIILQLMVDLDTLRQVATHLGLSPEALKARLKKIYRRCGVRTLPHAVAVAMRRGEIT